MDLIIAKYNYTNFSELNWCQNEGVMYQIDMTKSVSYGEEYYQKYINYENTDLSKKINKGRTDITHKYCQTLIDIGIGSGEFIKSSTIRVFGFDINPLAVKWLKENNLFLNPYEDNISGLDGFCFWDSLEHMPNPNQILKLIKKDQYAFVSMPVFEDLSKIKNSKHYRPDEHYYYFTENGLKKYMIDSNFSFVEKDDFETRAGRQDIQTFVFKKN